MNSVDNFKFLTMKTKFLEMMEEKFNFNNSKIHSLATFLDPRFKDKYTTDAFTFNQNIMQLINEECEEEGQDQEVLVSPATKRIRDERSFFGDDDDLDLPQPLQRRGVEAEIISYLKLKRIYSSENPLFYWKVNIVHIMA